MFAQKSGEDEGGKETLHYFVKWKGLPYSEATWYVVSDASLTLQEWVGGGETGGCDTVIGYGGRLQGTGY